MGRRCASAEPKSFSFSDVLCVSPPPRSTSQALVRQLQAEEDELSRQEYAWWERERQETRRRQDAATATCFVVHVSHWPYAENRAVNSWVEIFGDCGPSIGDD
jgi:hypothetical protein